MREIPCQLKIINGICCACSSYYEKFADGSEKCIDDEIPFEVPEGWEFERIKNIFITNPKNNIPDNLMVSFVPMALIEDKYSGSYSYEKKYWHECKKGFTHFAENDIGFAKISPCFENRKSVLFTGLVNGYGAGTTELLILRGYSKDILPIYVLYFVKSEYFIQRGKNTFSGVVGQQRINKDTILDTLIPIPPYNAQMRIIIIIKNILSYINEIEADLTEDKSLRTF